MEGSGGTPMWRPPVLWAAFLGWSVAALSPALAGFDAAWAPAGPAAQGWYAVTRVGDPLVVAAVGALCVGWAWWRGRMPVQATASIVLTWAATALVKVLVARPRPEEALVPVASAAYPSGHASMAVVLFALALPSLVVQRRLRIVARALGWVVAAFVGMSRIALHVHWASDVVGGALLAGACWETVRWLRLRWGGQGTAPQP